MRFLITLVLWVFSLNSFSQVTERFSKQQMYADFDTLVATLARTSPHIAIKRDLWNYDAISRIKLLRKGIDTISSNHSFAILIERALNTCQDFHTSIWSVPFEPAQNRQSVRLFLPVSYFNGSYYLSASVIAGKDTIRAGSVITAVNRIPIHQYVFDHLTDKVCSYDRKNHRFYSNRFYRNTSVKEEGTIHLTAVGPDKIKKDFDLPANERASFARSIYQDTLRQKVEYWPAEKVLYVRIFTMEANDIPFFMRKIHSFRDKATELKKIIIDVRDNQGGEDTVWIAVYQALLPKVKFHSQLSGYYPAYMDSDYVAEHSFDFSRVQKNSNPVLRKYKLYDYLNTTDSIVPADSSFNFAGKVIVIGNENIYSAGASLMMIPNASHSDNIISVGRKTDLFIGGGFSPVIFELPNSKIQFRVAPSVETNHAKSVIDLMQDNVEVEVPYSLKEIYTKEKYKGDAFGTDFLLHFDIFIKVALGL